MIRCLVQEDIAAHTREAINYDLMGDNYAALFHTRIALGLASEIKDSATEMALKNHQSYLRRQSPCAN